jgi:ADP-ribose pyrophosphatase YjhB (NUDIX family)
MAKPNQQPIRTYTAAGGVVVDPATGRVLALLRPGRTGPDGRPEVRLPKGHVESGEDCRRAALREVAEEAGVSQLEILADLGRQTVEFDWQGHHYVRKECYFLMALTPGAAPDLPEEQFECLWLAWEQALSRLTFEAEREWIRRARSAWTRLQNVPDQHTQQADDHSQV